MSIHNLNLTWIWVNFACYFEEDFQALIQRFWLHKSNSQKHCVGIKPLHRSISQNSVDIWNPSKNTAKSLSQQNLKCLTYFWDISANILLYMQRPLISSRQYEDHIEYLKSELTRVVSHLNKARAEVEESKENLSQAHNTIATLQTRLADSSSRASDSSKPR